MKSKKAPKADLERKRSLFLEIGLVLALGICLAAFEWSSEEVKVNDLGALSEDTQFVEDMIITRETPPPPPEEKIKEPEPVLLDLKVVDDKKEVKRINWTSELKDRNSPVIIFNGNDEVTKEKTEPIRWVDVKTKPIFPGGDAALLSFISKNTVYPEIPKNNNVDGKVYIQFVIDETGKVINSVVLVGIDPYLDAEALRVVSMLPNWTPGYQRDIAVPVSFIIPINFVLR
jgi:protein TonB